MHKLIFLGTSGSDSVLPQLRASGGIVFFIGKFQIHLDPGPGALFQARRFGVNPANTNIILVSHNHLSHCNDLNIIIDGMSYQGLDTKGVVIGNESVIHGTNLEKPVINKRQSSFVEQVVSLPAGKHATIGYIRIDSLKTKHTCLTGVGFKLTTDQYVYSYTGDTAYFPELHEQYKGTDVLIVNNVHPFGIDSQENLNSSDTMKLVEEVKPRLVLLTHFGKQILKLDPIYDARKIQQETGVKVIVAKDGLLIDPSEYIEPRSMKSVIQS